MNKQTTKRGLSLLLSLLMVLSLFTVCSIATVSAADEVRIQMQTWGASTLATAAGKETTRNSHGKPLFTTVQGMIGRRSLNQDNFFIHNVHVPLDDKDSNPWIYTGAITTMIVRVLAEGEFTEGVLAQVQTLYGATVYADLYCNPFVIDFESYEAQPTLTDPVFGYEYKEFYFPCEFYDDIYDEDRTCKLEMRIRDQHETANLIVYSMEMLDEYDNIMVSCSGPGWATAPGTPGTYENALTSGDQVAAIASYAGTDDKAVANRGEPYCSYNADGFNKEEVRLLSQGMGKLPAGNYALDFLQSTQKSLGMEKCRYEVMAGTEKVTELHLTKADIDATIGSDSGAWETRTLEFALTEAQASKDISFNIYVYNQTDYMIQSATLYSVTSDEITPAAQAVCDMIDALEIDDADAIAAARLAYDALSETDKIWVGSDRVAKLESYEAAQTAAAALNDAIAALGDPADLTSDNYSDKTEDLEAVEAEYKSFARTYGATDAAKLVDKAALDAYREAYDAAAKGVEIQKAVDAIDAIGALDTFTEDNVDDKQALVDAANDAVDELISVYGARVTDEIPNYANIAAAQAKIDELKGGSFTLGDVNEDGNIDAADALMVLQHAVKLVTLEGNPLKAADTTKDNVADASDALKILQYAVKLIDQF